MEDSVKKNFEELEKQIKKHLVIFCKALPEHVEKWKSVLQLFVRPVQNLANFGEQQRHVKRVKDIFYFECFQSAQSGLLYLICKGAEEEILVLKGLIEKLNNLNHDLMMKFHNFERSAKGWLNLPETSLLMRGNHTQPPLPKVFRDAIAFVTFFSTSCQHISGCFKILNLDVEQSITDFRDSLSVDLECKLVTGLIAVTQYMDNENSIV